MKINELKLTANRKHKRVGRGIAAGQGKTAGRGTKGQGSRAGSTRKPGFEGGQNPLMRRLPKLRGFRSFKIAPETVYTGSLAEVKGTVDNFSLFDAGLVSSPYTRVKLVISGADLSGKPVVKLQAASTAAIALIEKAGGSFAAVPQVMRQTKTTKEDK